jgi:arsenate reductase-like glutaredoxin family protein
LLSDHGIEFEVQDMIQQSPSKEVLVWMASQMPNGAKDLLSPIKAEMEDPYYVAHIKGQENRLTDEEYIDLFYRFPDLLKKPIVTNQAKIAFGYNEEELKSLIA